MKKLFEMSKPTNFGIFGYKSSLWVRFACMLFCMQFLAGATDCQSGINSESLENSQISHKTIGDVSGKVVDADQNPVFGASVWISSRSTITNESGSFFVGGITAGSHLLTLSANGFEPFDTTVDVKPGSNSLGMLQLEPEACTGTCAECGFENHVRCTNTMIEKCTVDGWIPIQDCAPYACEQESQGFAFCDVDTCVGTCVECGLENNTRCTDSFLEECTATGWTSVQDCAPNPCIQETEDSALCDNLNCIGTCAECGFLDHTRCNENLVEQCTSEGWIQTEDCGDLFCSEQSQVYAACQPLDTLSGVVQVASGANHTCALFDTDEVRCWGENLDGQLGYSGGNYNELEPVTVNGALFDVYGVIQIAAGGGHTCALLDTGGVQCWGDNAWGQLGDDESVSSVIPKYVVGLSSGVVSISAGHAHTCAVLNSGALKCWGENSYGQLGNGANKTERTPVDVIGLSSGVVQVAAGTYFTCARLGSGAVKCFGKGEDGQLGNGENEDHNTPVDVIGLSTYVDSVSVYGRTACALSVFGGVQCWGNNSYGQLGGGIIADQNTPVSVMGLGKGVTAISNGLNHVCALLNTGAVRCWGIDYYGELGDGSNGWGEFAPVDVQGLSSGVVQISAKGHHTCALLNTSEIKCWGHNFYGELGTQDTKDRSVPTYVLNPSLPCQGTCTECGQEGHTQCNGLQVEQCQNHDWTFVDQCEHLCIQQTLDTGDCPNIPGE